MAGLSAVNPLADRSKDQAFLYLRIVLIFIGITITMWLTILYEMKKAGVPLE